MKWIYSLLLMASVFLYTAPVRVEGPFDPNNMEQIQIVEHKISS